MSRTSAMRLYVAVMALGMTLWVVAFWLALT